MMVNTVTNETTPQDALQSAEKVMPTLRATEKTSKVEMQKLIDQVEKNIGQIGPFARVYGEKGTKGRFAVFNEPVTFAQEGEGEKAVYDIGLVCATPDGFKSYQFPNIAASKLEGEKFRLGNKIEEMDNVANKEKIVPEYAVRGREQGIYVGGYFGLNLTDVNDQSIVVNAIESSIAKAQEGPIKTIANNRQVIGMATNAQATIAKSVIK